MGPPSAWSAASPSVDYAKTERTLMPVVRVEMLAGRSRDQKREIAETFTRELARVARCGPEHVQIIFTDVERQDWALGGALADEETAATAS
jgi:4-oxalocrotonate tautomerase